MTTFCKIAKKHAEEKYLKTHDELKDKPLCYDAFVTLWCIIEQYTSKNGSWDKIISCVDPDSRVAHKSRHTRKRGYKNHIIVDEDSEIILASEETPFNVNDKKKFIDLIEKVESNFNLKPKEVSADKAYGTINNRAYLKDNEITGNIVFPDTSNREYIKYDISKFEISDNMQRAQCPNGCITENYRISKNKEIIRFKFSKEICTKCPKRELCISPKNFNKNVGRNVEVSVRYDVVIRDKKRNETSEFEVTLNKRYIVERRFATLVRNHGLRRSRYLRLEKTKVHIILANTASNIVRMVSLLCNNSKASLAIP